MNLQSEVRATKVTMYSFFVHECMKLYNPFNSCSDQQLWLLGAEMKRSDVLQYVYPRSDGSLNNESIDFSIIWFYMNSFLFISSGFDLS